MRRRFAAFPALVGVLVLASLTTWPGAGAGAVPGDPRAARSDLLVRIADLTDRLETSQATLVAAQFEQDRLAAEIADVRARVRARAVRAYIHGTGLAVSDAGARELAAPAAYLEVAARKDREQSARLRAALKAAERREAEADSLRSSLRAADTDLQAARVELERLIAEDEARRLATQRASEEAAAQRAAEQARLRAMAEASAAAVQARARAASEAGAGSGSGSGSGGSGAPHPGGLEVPRHRRATEAQAALFAKYPFGILPPTGPLPAGLTFTGRREVGLASWYGGMFNGRPTASGAIYDQELWTAASRTLPLGTFVVVSRGGVRVLLLINDRGPYVDGRIIDLSAIAARALDVGVSEVTVEVVVPPSG